MNQRPNNPATALPPAAARSRLRQAYAQSQALDRPAQEEKWILDHLPLVRHIAQKVAYGLRGKVDFDDLISAGTVGLVRAAQSFDPSREVEFKTYAYIRVRGAILDEMRNTSFVPASVCQQVRAIEAAYRRMSAENGKPPSDEDLAREVDLPIERMYKVLEESRHQSFLSIHGLTDDSPSLEGIAPPSRGESPDVEAERKEMLERMAQAICDLPERDRHVLLLYYERDLTMKETAQVLGVTESRVSQLHASALFKLAMKLGRTP